MGNLTKLLICVIGLTSLSGLCLAQDGAAATAPAPTSRPALPQLTVERIVSPIQEDNVRLDDRRRDLLRFRVSADRVLDASLDVRITFDGGNAKPGEDFHVPRGPFKLEKGKKTADFTIELKDDQVPEYAEYVKVTLQASADKSYELVADSTIAWMEIFDDESGFAEDEFVVSVNKDDDNNNGIPDGQEWGFVAGEDNLTKLEIVSPAEYVEGATMVLSMTQGDKSRVWLTPDKQEAMVLGLGKDQHVWKLSKEHPTFPKAVYIEGIEGGRPVFSVSFNQSPPKDEDRAAGK